MMYVKIHKSKEREILVICDEDILGKTFEENELQLKVSESFYKGEKKSEKEVIDLISNYDNINLAGKKTIRLAKDNKLIDESSVINISGVPHVQMYAI